MKKDSYGEVVVCGKSAMVRCIAAAAVLIFAWLQAFLIISVLFTALNRR